MLGGIKCWLRRELSATSKWPTFAAHPPYLHTSPPDHTCREFQTDGFTPSSCSFLKFSGVVVSSKSATFDVLYSYNHIASSVRGEIKVHRKRDLFEKALLPVRPPILCTQATAPPAVLHTNRHANRKFSGTIATQPGMVGAGGWVGTKKKCLVDTKTIRAFIGSGYKRDPDKVANVQQKRDKEEGGKKEAKPVVRLWCFLRWH